MECHGVENSGMQVPRGARNCGHQNVEATHALETERTDGGSAKVLTVHGETKKKAKKLN
jgi:hypothetical protein